MKFVVISPSLQWFLREIPEKFGNDKIMAKSSGYVKNYTTGHSYQYISSELKLRGLRGVDVEFWGPHPAWYKDNMHMIDGLLQAARGP